jgi:hypothetical protein
MHFLRLSEPSRRRFAYLLPETQTYKTSKFALPRADIPALERTKMTNQGESDELFAKGENLLFHRVEDNHP